MNEEQIKHLKKLVAALSEWQLCMSYNDSYFGEPSGLVKRTTRELMHLIDSFESATQPAQEWQAEEQKAINDMLLYGTGFTVGGKHVPIENVMMFSNPEVTPAPSQDRCCDHDSDCAVHNAPAYPVGPCDCTLSGKPAQDQVDAALESAVQAVMERAGEAETILLVSAFDAIRSLKKYRYAAHNKQDHVAAARAVPEATERKAPPGWDYEKQGGYLIGYRDCNCVLSHYCDGKCRPIFEYRSPDPAPSPQPELSGGIDSNEFRNRLRGLRNFTLQETMDVELNEICEAIDAWKDAACAEIAKDRDHWKANHADVVSRLRIATQRPDLPVDRIPAIKEMDALRQRATDAEAKLAAIREPQPVAEQGELLPCPFCGGAAALQEHEAHTHSGPLKALGIADHPGSCTIECIGSPDCNTGQIADTRAEVVATWNRRAASQQAAEPVALDEARAAMERAKLLPIWDNINHALHVELDVIFKALAAPAIHQPQDERAAFEADMQKHGFWSEMARSSDGAGYRHKHIADMWTGWQARAALAQRTSTPSQSDTSCIKDCRTGTQTVRELAATMIEMKQKESELTWVSKGHRINLYVKILRNMPQESDTSGLPG